MADPTSGEIRAKGRRLVAVAIAQLNRELDDWVTGENRGRRSEDD